MYQSLTRNIDDIIYSTLNTNQPKYFKVLILCIGALITTFVIVGIISGVLGLVIKDYVNFSPSYAFVPIGFEWIDLNSRLVFDVGFTSGLVISILVMCFFATLISYLIYVIMSHERSSWKKVVIWCVTGSVSILISYVIIFVLVPGMVVRGMYSIAAMVKVSEAKSLLKSEEIDTNYDSVLQSLISASDFKIYPDYGIDGLLLAVILQNTKGRNLSHFESFYLPIYFSKKDIPTEFDGSKLIKMGENTYIIGPELTKEDVEDILRPLAEKYTFKTYSGLVKSMGKLKTFTLINDEKYSAVSKEKLLDSYNKVISENEKSYAVNEGIIKEYPILIDKLNKDYQKYVVELEKEYELGCVQKVRYSDCTDFKATTEKNRMDIEEARKDITNNFNDANRINAEISILLKDMKSELEQQLDIEDNITEQSDAVAFGSDTIFIRYIDGRGIDSDLIRLTVHELLHIYSHNDEKYLPTAFDEGMTEYLAHRAMGFSEKDSVRVSGYPLEVQVIYALLEKIPEEDLVNAYFSMDEKIFKSLFKKHFTDTSYDSFIREYNRIFDATYNVGGEGYTFNNELFDHERVRKIRMLLGLELYRYQTDF
jgi:hypothetical protein